MDDGGCFEGELGYRICQSENYHGTHGRAFRAGTGVEYKSKVIPQQFSHSVLNFLWT